MNNNNPDGPLDIRPPTTPPSFPTPPPPPPTEPQHPPNAVVSNPTPTLTLTPAAFASSSSTALTIVNSNAPQRKKRSKLTRPDDDDPANKRPKTAKKPDPSAPKITTPCSECGRTFWSWKALFGHMRCHPERHWRGIQPPPNFQRGSSWSNPVHHPELESSMSEDDHDAASSLLILAGGTDQTQTQSQTQLVPGTSGCRENDSGGCRFECSSCKKVFGSHQALGGHRASHKNVKGCFAITKNDADVDEEQHLHDGHEQHGTMVVVAGRSYGVEESNVGESTEGSSRMVMVAESGHQCSICWRVFSSGQALGGHKRCHWERGEEASVVMTQFGTSSNVNSGGLDLNLPAPASASVADPNVAAASALASEDDQGSSYSSPNMGLDLRLGL